MAHDPTHLAPDPLLPQFRWNAATKQYIAPNGQFVSRRLIRDQLDSFITGVTEEARTLSIALADGNISLTEWRRSMISVVKSSNLAGGTLQGGGYFNTSGKLISATEKIIEQELTFLDEFANQINTGEQKLDGTVGRRAQLYAQNGRATYYKVSRIVARDDGFTEEASRLTPADHCTECVSEEAAGFRPLGQMVPVGERICNRNCKCFVVFRNPETGEERVT